jgi:hypothetical protein
MQKLAESSFSFKFMFDECNAVMSVERGCRVWRGRPTGPLDGIVEELNSLFNVFRSFRGMLRVRRSVIRRRKKSQFVRRLLKRGGVSGGRACVVSTTMTGEWSDDRSKQDIAQAEFWGIPFVTLKSKRSGILFLSEGQ